MYYKLRSEGKGYWLPGGFGYTWDADKAGLFHVSELSNYSLDGVTLIAAKKKTEEQTTKSIIAQKLREAIARGE